MERYLTIKEVATMFKVSPNAIRMRIRSGQLAATKPFGKLLIKVTDMQKHLKRTQV